MTAKSKSRVGHIVVAAIGLSESRFLQMGTLALTGCMSLGSRNLNSGHVWYPVEQEDMTEKVTLTDMLPRSMLT